MATAELNPKSQDLLEKNDVFFQGQVHFMRDVQYSNVNKNESELRKLQKEVSGFISAYYKKHGNTVNPFELIKALKNEFGERIEIGVAINVIAKKTHREFGNVDVAVIYAKDSKGISTSICSVVVARTFSQREEFLSNIANDKEFTFGRDIRVVDLQALVPVGYREAYRIPLIGDLSVLGGMFRFGGKTEYGYARVSTASSYNLNELLQEDPENAEKMLLTLAEDLAEAIEKQGRINKVELTKKGIFKVDGQELYSIGQTETAMNFLNLLISTMKKNDYSLVKTAIGVNEEAPVLTYTFMKGDRKIQLSVAHVVGADLVNDLLQSASADGALAVTKRDNEIVLGVQKENGFEEKLGLGNAAQMLFTDIGKFDYDSQKKIYLLDVSLVKSDGSRKLVTISVPEEMVMFLGLEKVLKANQNKQEDVAKRKTNEDVADAPQQKTDNTVVAEPRTYDWLTMRNQYREAFDHICQEYMRGIKRIAPSLELTTSQHKELEEILNSVSDVQKKLYLLSQWAGRVSNNINDKKSQSYDVVRWIRSSSMALLEAKEDLDSVESERDWNRFNTEKKYGVAVVNGSMMSKQVLTGSEETLRLFYRLRRFAKASETHSLAEVHREVVRTNTADEMTRILKTARSIDPNQYVMYSNLRPIGGSSAIVLDEASHVKRDAVSIGQMLSERGLLSVESTLSVKTIYEIGEGPRIELAFSAKDVSEESKRVSITFTGSPEMAILFLNTVKASLRQPGQRVVEQVDKAISVSELALSGKIIAESLNRRDSLSLTADVRISSGFVELRFRENEKDLSALRVLGESEVDVYTALLRALLSSGNLSNKSLVLQFNGDSSRSFENFSSALRGLDQNAFGKISIEKIDDSTMKLIFQQALVSASVQDNANPKNIVLENIR